MLQVNIDSKLGILFVRLSGKISKKDNNKLKELINFIEKVGIKNIVINTKELINIEEGLKLINICYNLCENSFLCINEKQINKVKNVKYILDETEVVNLINI